MNKRIERQLEAESESDSRGYVTDRPLKVTIMDSDGQPPNIALAGGPAMWSMPESEVAIEALAGVTELLDLARSQER